MSAEPQRTCSNCGNELSGSMEFCPVCMLRKGLAGGVESGEASASEDTVKPTLERVVQRFEHYQLVTGEDGKPVELGRGAMGVTYKAFAVDLRCPVSVARLPVTGSDVFGRDEDIAFLDRAWAKKEVNVVTIVPGLGSESPHSSTIGFEGWQLNTIAPRSSSLAGPFTDRAVVERLRRRMNFLMPLSLGLATPIRGSEPAREPSLQALLRELAAFNTGLCVITTRTPVADIADHERNLALRRDLEHLSSDAGAKLLRALGVNGHEAELRTASDEFRGHSLALTLLGSYLTDAYHGDIRRRQEVSAGLAHDVRQGAHARKVMESYQSWFGEGPELSVLRMLGLFDRPAEEKAFEALLKSPRFLALQSH